MTKKMQKFYKIKIELEETKIWRIIEVHSDIDFEYFHRILQLVMCWKDYHLYQFEFPTFKIPSPECYDDISEFREIDKPVSTRLSEVFKKGTRFIYLYDFGDMWIHKLEVMEEIKYPHDSIETLFPVRCLDGAKNDPPEDVGSIYGYKSLVKSMKSKKGEYLNNLQWLGYEYDENDFDIDFINKVLRKFL